MSQVFLLRHGSTSTPGSFCGSTDSVLTQEGWQQMWAAVTGQVWDRVVSSPARRCAEFGASCARRLNLPFNEDARLREMHFGDWEGCSPAELMQSVPEALRLFWQDPARYPPPRGEPLAAVRSRVLMAWNELVAGDPTQRVLVVTHGGPMRILRCLLDPRASERLLDIDVPYATVWNMNVFLRAEAASAD